MAACAFLYYSFQSIFFSLNTTHTRKYLTLHCLGTLVLLLFLFTEPRGLGVEIFSVRASILSSKLTTLVDVAPLFAQALLEEAGFLAYCFPKGVHVGQLNLNGVPQYLQSQTFNIRTITPNHPNLRAGSQLVVHSMARDIIFRNDWMFTVPWKKPVFPDLLKLPVQQITKLV